ncbi:hypothetical protein FGB62_112g021 [Gracilaria domingensis]|nr:hypothetical protein FGB62_112g021 [Gracilaria domingensis]
MLVLFASEGGPDQDLRIMLTKSTLVLTLDVAEHVRRSETGDGQCRSGSVHNSRKNVSRRSFGLLSV